MLANVSRAATNLSAVLLGICPRRRRQPMRIKNGQCLFGVLSRQLLLTVCQICFSKSLIRISRFSISKLDELQDIDRCLRIARANVILTDGPDVSVGE